MKRKNLILKIVLTLGVFLVANFLGGCTNSNPTKKATASKEITKVLTKQKFTKLKIKSQNADVTIIKGKSYKISYQGKSSTVPVVKKAKNQLVVDQVKAEHALGIMKLPKIIVQVPKDAKLSTLNIETDSADARITGISLKNCTVSSDSGDIAVTSSKSVSGMKLTSTTGDIKVKNTNFTGYRLTTKDGQIQVKNRSIAHSYVKKAKTKNVLVAKTGSREIWIQ